jgi:hypothetical protein
LTPGKVLVYPNPGREHLNFAFTVSGDIHVVIDIFNISAERVAQMEENQKAGSGQTLIARWDCSQAAAGVYIARIVIRDASGELVLKQIKKVAVVR